MLKLKDLKVNIEGKEVVKGVNLEVKEGEIAVIMGPNGSGKSTLANGIMGHPKMEVEGHIILDGEELTGMQADERSKKGLFLSFQYPAEISGVTITNFLRTALNSRRPKEKQIKLIDFITQINEKMDLLHIPRNFASRYINEGFSGGEKKKMEILQLALLEPKVAILDETDSGLDIDALRTVCESINIMKAHNPKLTILLITHYQRMLNYLKPDSVHIMLDGQIVKSGGPELAHELEKEGYAGHKK